MSSCCTCTSKFPTNSAISHLASHTPSGGALLTAYFSNNRHARVVQHLREVREHLHDLLLSLGHILQLELGHLRVVTDAAQELLEIFDVSLHGLAIGDLTVR